MNRRGLRPMDAAAFAPANPGDRPPNPAPSREKKKSVVVSIDPRLLARFRSHCAETRQSPTEVILTAHLNSGDAVQRALRPTEADRRRIALGLPHAAASGHLGPGKPLSLWLSATAVAELTAAAKSVGVTRRRYLTELVAAALAAANTPAQPHPQAHPELTN